MIVPLNGWLRSPVNASPMPSRAAAHDPGYFFIVMDLHHLLSAGLPAHSGLPRRRTSVRHRRFSFVLCCVFAVDLPTGGKLCCCTRWRPLTSASGI
jgi:hypothetical protein